MKLNVQNTKLEMTAGMPSQFPSKQLPQIAFAGRSNVGKSSLINSLLCRKSLARVSGSPGKTITINFYNIDEKLYLVDLPGYGYAKRSEAERRKFSSLTDGYFTGKTAPTTLRGVVQLVDMKVGATDDDIMMIDFLTQMNIPFFIAATKSDKLNATNRAKQYDELLKLCNTVVPFSALNGEGRDDIFKNMLALIEK